jgi:hypothetical protein
MKQFGAALIGLLGLFVVELGCGLSHVADAKTAAALAVVPGHGRVYHGYAKRDSVPNARAAALAKCARKNCIVVQVYTPPQCAHLALGKHQIFWNNRRFSRSERAAVLDECRRVDDNCEIIVSDCIK